MEARSLGDKRAMPLVERAANNTGLGLINSTERRPNSLVILV